MNGGNKNSLSYGIKFAAFALLAFLVAIATFYTGNLRASHSVTEASFFNPLSTTDIDKKSENEYQFITDSTGIKKGKRSFMFYENESGNRVLYKAKLNNGKLEELSIGGNKIDSEKLSDYSNKIDTKIAERESILSEYKKNKNEYKKLFKEYSEKMSEQREKLKDYGIKSHKHHFDFDEPDFSDFRKSMRELRRSLKESFAGKNIVIPPIHIPEINIPEIYLPEIHIPSIQIPPIHVPPLSKFDDEKWDEWQKGLNENMKDFNETMKKLDMGEFKESMKEFKMNMGKFKTEMKKFGKFMDNAKEEMVKDNLIETEDDLDDFLLSEDKFEVNGQEVSHELHTKYLDMYEKYTGKKLEGEKKIRINY